MLEYTKLSTEAHQMQDATYRILLTRVALNRIQWHIMKGVITPGSIENAPYIYI